VPSRALIFSICSSSNSKPSASTFSAMCVGFELRGMTAMPRCRAQRMTT
jgi:hypothetical protein